MTSSALIEKCCLLTDDAAGDPTHFMIDRAFEQLGLDWRFLTFEVKPARLAEVLAGVDALGFRGVMLSTRLRQLAGGLWTDLTPAAERAGAINSLVRLGDTLTGDNTRVGALRQAVGDIVGRHVVVLGAGNDARTLASTVLADNPANLAIASRRETELCELASQLGEMLQGEMPGEASDQSRVTSIPLTTGDFVLPTDTDLLIVCASEGEACIDVDSLPAEITVVDTTLQSSRTALVKAAASRGLTIVDGVTLAANEVALAVERWTGESLDRLAMRDSVEEFLGF